LEKIEINTTSEMVENVYSKLEKNIAVYRKTVSRSLTLTEKILAGHLQESFLEKNLDSDGSYVFLQPDRVALQDVTGQMVMLQFMQTGLSTAALPTTVHCDHLIQARTEGKSDTKLAIYENNEVYKFLESSASKYGVGFWKPGAGIIHQVILENYAFPGGLMIGTDSHTPNAGGLGMLAIGVGGVDAAETMAGMPWEILYPRRIGIYLKGEMNGWTAAKDVILYVAGELSVSGGTNSIIEYFGPGTKSISCTGKATITNMGAEIGATCSIFPYDERMELYLKSTGREEIAELANKYKEHLVGDSEIENDPGKYFDKSNLPNPANDFEWEYILIDNDKVRNAWCMPGGKIAVYTGILKITKNQNGLAAVMGHEIAHAVAKHSVERASRGIVVNLATQITDILSGGKLSQVNRATGMNTIGLLSQIGILNPFNRKQESEADYLGLIFSSLSGYDIRETVKIWERMKAANKGKEPSEFMSTHPSSANRIKNINGWTNQIILDYPPILAS